MSANDKQVGGDHYQKSEVQHWDWAQHLGYLEGNATKYIARHQDKHGLQDIEKALHYIQKIVERDYPGHALRWSIGASDSRTQRINEQIASQRADSSVLQNPYANIAPHD